MAKYLVWAKDGGSRRTARLYEARSEDAALIRHAKVVNHGTQGPNLGTRKKIRVHFLRNALEVVQATRGDLALRGFIEEAVAAIDVFISDESADTATDIIDTLIDLLAERLRNMKAFDLSEALIREIQEARMTPSMRKRAKAIEEYLEKGRSVART